ncbi:MAG: hypothetical protein JWQ87_5298 [Candidatus Sulfotelmatobacter sp.]|nr:hypothetical protein [Candidatus Sulfotelmatobacter sp.]
MRTSVQIILFISLVEIVFIVFLACFLHKTRRRYRYALAIRSAAGSRRCPDGSRVETSAVISGLPEPIFSKAELETLFKLVNQPTPMSDALLSVRSESCLVLASGCEADIAEGGVSARSETAEYASRP